MSTSISHLPMFSHLRVHSEFSLVDGTIRIKKLAALAKSAGFDSIALTDINNIFGLLKFYQSAQAVNIKPILGAEVWVRSAEGVHKLVLLCQNNQGYTHLCEIISEAYLYGQQDHRIAVNIDALSGRTAGLIALSAAHEGVLGKLLGSAQFDAAKKLLATYKNLFFKQFYIEVQRLGKPEEPLYFERALTLASSTQTPAVATNHVCFPGADDFYAHEARVCINQGNLLSDDNRPRNYVESQYLKSAKAMQAAFSDYPQLLENAHRIAQKCNVSLHLGKNYLPAFTNDLGLSEDDYLEKLARGGLETRLKQRFTTPEAIASVRQKYEQRLAFEIGIINHMGFPGYFLIVADFIRWSKNNDIPVGPGRGSGAGSLVAYCLDITDLDPIQYDLLFERFLNPERVSMPDFDIDFCMDKRDLVIDYVVSKYGREKVSQIATHGTMAAKAVIRDAGRVLGYGYGFVDSIAKLVPFKPGMTLTEALTVEPEFKRRYDSDDEARIIIDLALSLEGLARNVGKHAGGVVISPSKLTDFSALYCEQDGKGLSVQYDKDDIESAGLIKFDFLGLRTLTVIDWALKSINKKRQMDNQEPIDILDIALDDKATYQLFKRCQTTAVFQLESTGMKELIKRLQPDCFDDIIALVALYRPGPLGSGMVDDFINVKHGRAPANYPLPQLEPILKSTYGVILYQEQVMQIAQMLASYTLGEADMLRRAMGKKKPQEMARQGEKFTAGAVKNGHDREKAKYIFDLMEKFAGYGFNKSHSAAYALLAYQTAWLKTHYPAEFMAAVLSTDMDNTDKVVTLIEECRQMGLTIDNPSLNASDYAFSVSAEKTIVYGLGAIKGAGEAALKSLLQFRAHYGQVHSIVDFFSHADFSKLNKRVLEALICAGVFDQLEPNRRYLLQQLPEFLKLAEQTTENKKTGQADLFGLGQSQSLEQHHDDILKNGNDQPRWNERERLQREKAAIGLYLTGHPIDSYKSQLLAILNQQTLASTMSRIEEDNDTNASRRGGRKKQSIWVAGLITDIRLRQGKNGKMAFITIDDRSARAEISCFSQSYEANKDAITVDEIVLIQGRAGYDDFSQQWKINAEHIYRLSEVPERFAKAIQITVDMEVPERLAPIIKIVNDGLSASSDSENNDKAPKDTGASVYFHLKHENMQGKIQLPKGKRLKLSPHYYQQLLAICGRENLNLHYHLNSVNTL